MEHQEKQLALEIAQRFIEMQEEIRSLRVVLRRYWTHETDSEAFVRKGIQQLQSHERGVQGFQYLELIFHAATDGDALMRILHDQTLGRATVPEE
jgi:hypothetical protein